VSMSSLWTAATRRPPSREHIDALIPAIEIVDYRFESWDGWCLARRCRQRDPRLVAFMANRSRTGAATYLAASAVSVHPCRRARPRPVPARRWWPVHSAQRDGRLADELPRFGLQLSRGDVVTNRCCHRCLRGRCG
jgi:hypothetical protein